MAASTSPQGSLCAKCGHALLPGALLCGNCRRLTYADQLNQLANRARQLTALGRLDAARDLWSAALPYLPDSPERRGVEQEIEKLEARLTPRPAFSGESRLSAFAIPILAKLVFPLSMLAFIGVYWSLLGWALAVGISVSVLLHEMGHFVTIRHFGFKAELPTFLPGLGAFVRWRGTNVDPGVRAIISLAGPLFGFLSGVIALGVYRATGHHVWLAIAEFAGWLNLLNLVPVSIFDGGAAMGALGRQTRILVLVSSLVMFFFLRDYLFLLVAGGTAYRLTTRDFPERPNQTAGLYFIALAAANGLLAWYCRQQGFSLFSGF